VTGVWSEDVPPAFTCMMGMRQIFGATGVDTSMFLGPPDLVARDGFDGTGNLIRGRGGGISVTGIEGGR